MRCYTGTVRSVPKAKKASRERGCIQTVVWKNPANRSRIGPKFGWYGKVNQNSGRFTNLPFHFRMNRKGRSTVQNCWVSTGTRKYISLTELVTLSQYIRETLFSYQCFLISGNKLSKFNFSEPQNSFFFNFFFNFITDVF